MNKLVVAVLSAGLLALGACDNIEFFPEDQKPLPSREDRQEAQAAEAERQPEPAPQQAAPPRVDPVADADEVLLIRNARLLTMDGPVIEKGSVLIADGVIVEVAAGNAIDAPRGAEVLNARGRTLLPGLADMHVHHWSENEGPLFIAHGITSVRNMWGTGMTVWLDRGAKDRAYPGPRVYTPGPLMDGPEPVWGEDSLVVTSEEMARGAVRAQKATGFAAIKLYEKLEPAVYRAAVDEARKQGLRVYSHTPMAMTAREVASLGIDSLEHLDDVEDALVPEGFETPQDRNGYLATWAAADTAKMAPLATLFAGKNVANSVTLEVILGRYERMLDTEGFFESEAGQYVDRDLKTWWMGSAERSLPGLTPQLVAAAKARQFAFVKALHDAGAPLLIGSDTPNPFVVPGISLHGELASFEAAGIAREDILAIATREAAAFLGASDEFGRISKGLRADLILVDGDPLEDLATLRRPDAVIAAGRLYDRAALDALLEGARTRAAASYRQEPAASAD